MKHRVGGEMHEITAVEIRYNSYAAGKNALIKLLDLVVNGDERGIFVRALLQQHDAADDVIFIDDFAVQAMNCISNLAEPDLRALPDVSDILDPQRRPVLRLENRLLDIADQADLANIDLLLTLLDEVAAGIDIVVAKLLLHLSNRHTVRHQLVGVDLHLVLAGHSTEARDINHSRY